MEILFSAEFFMLRYFNLEPSFKLLWCRARDLFGSQIPVTTGICNPNESLARHHHTMNFSEKIQLSLHVQCLEGVSLSVSHLKMR